MKRTEAIDLQVTGLALVSSLATVLLCLTAAGAFTGIKLWSEIAAGWAAAVATVIAVWVALRANDHARRLRDEEWDRQDAERAKAEKFEALARIRSRVLVGKPLLAEIEALRANLQGLASFQNVQIDESTWNAYFTFVGGIDSPVFDLYSTRLDCLPEEVASKVVLSYAVLSRLRAEIARRIPPAHAHIGSPHGCWQLRVVSRIAASVEGSLEDAHQAIHRVVSISCAEVAVHDALASMGPS